MRVHSVLGKAPEVEKTPTLRQRPNADVYEDPNYDWKKHDPKLADDVVDQVMAAHDGYADPTHAPDASVRDELERQERQFLQALPKAINDQIRSQGMVVMRAQPDGTGDGYLIKARDSAGRRFEAALTMDEGIAIGHERGETMGRGIVDLLCKKLLDARANYFARMQ